MAWARARLDALEHRNLEPILTLLHHGSGPAHTNLTDPEFPAKFAAYAGAIAAAFPWILRWTPINEPLTTARFSTLYGLWYPNLRDDVAFGHAIAHQALGMLLAMEAIRRYVPDAHFVLTEDLQSFTALDPGREADARHQSERMFLSIELVMGRLVPGHALYRYLTETCNVSGALLAKIAERASPPELIGWNYYPNSERVLGMGSDGRPSDQPRVAFAPGSLAPQPLLAAAHERLQRPFGISEVHVNAAEDARVRWLVQRYDDALALEADGYPIRMLGAWAAFGSIDWDSLLTRREEHREDGIFAFAGDGERPRPTAVADAVRAMARGERPDLPQEPGWWETSGSPR